MKASKSTLCGLMVKLEGTLDPSNLPTKNELLYGKEVQVRRWD